MAIDILENQDTNKSADNRPGLMGRFLQGMARGSVFLPDMAENLGSRTGNMLGDLLGSKVPSQIDKYLNPHEKSLIESGVIDPNYPQANTYGEKFIDMAGAGTGTLLPFLPLKGGTQSMFGSIPRATSTIGSVVAPAAIGPKVDEWDNHNPWITVPAQIMASILGGKTGRGIGNLVSGKEPLPEYTAAQNSYMQNPDSPRTRDLVAKQLDLAKKDPKSADALAEITKNQEEKIIKNFTPENHASGEDIANKTRDYVSQLKAERSREYQQADSQLMANAPEKVDVSNTLNLIRQMRLRAAKGGNLEHALDQAEALVTQNADNPQGIMDARSTLQGLANYSPDLKLDSTQSGVIKQIAAQFGDDIEKSMPGYAGMNKNYSQSTKKLEGIIDGLGGKVVAAGETAPSSIPRRMFEDVDPALSGQMKGVLPDGLYGQAADAYLADVLERAQTTPTKNVYNNGTQMYKMGDILAKNYPTLQQTLPTPQMAKVDQAMKDIDVTMLGRPRNDFPIDARRGYAVGDEVKGLGKSAADGSLANPLTWIPKIARAATTPLNRNEMLTGNSPSAQIMGGITKPSYIAGAMNQPPLQQPINQQPLPQQAQQVPQRVPQNIAPPSSYKPPVSNGPSPIDQVLQQYGIGKEKSHPQSTSPIDDVLKQYGIGGSTNKQTNKQPNSPQMTPSTEGAIGSDVLDFMNKELKKGNMDVLLNPKEAFRQSQLRPDVNDVVKNSLGFKESRNNYNAQSPNSSAAGKYQFIDSTREMYYPDTSREEFKNNPQMQEDAMNKLLADNTDYLRNKGIDVDNIPREDLSGALHAAHLRGASAGYNTLIDPNYVGIADANGTTPRSYFNRGRQSYLNAVMTAENKQNEDYNNLIQSAENLLSGNSNDYIQGV